MKKKFLQFEKSLKVNSDPTVHSHVSPIHQNENIFDALPYGVIILKEFIDETGNYNLNYIVQNKVAAHYTGLNTSEILFKNFKEHPGILPVEYIPVFFSIIRNGGALHDEILINSGSNKIFLEINCSKVPEGLAISLVNITHYKDLNSKFLKLEALLNETQALAIVGSFEYNFSNKAIFCSKEIYKILGMNKGSEITVEGVVNLIHPDDKNRVKEHFYDLTGKHFEGEARIILSSGLEKVLFCKMNISYDDNNIPAQILGLVSDVTGKKTVEEELARKNIEISLAKNKIEEAKKELETSNHGLRLHNGVQAKDLLKKKNQLERLNKELDNFVYTASHDLQSPLSNIEGLINALVLEIDSEKTETQYIIELLRLSLGKVKNTLHDMSEIALMKDKEDVVQHIDFKSVFDEVKFSIHEEILKYSADIEADFSRAPTIFFSRKNLKSIVLNLLTNALKYSSPLRQPTINLSTYIENEFLILSVKDNGLGIKPEDKEKIFSVFKRVYTHVSGSGIGLYIVKRIVEINDGKIEVESLINSGTTFKVFFTND
ncbi:MAG: PAS domain-containing sensor histidine kinase [Bacteroidota bacterium]|nr:PAS domain-containing sensor histidine kinase [Bacteroidota bacterium]